MLISPSSLAATAAEKRYRNRLQTAQLTVSPAGAAPIDSTIFSLAQATLTHRAGK